MRFLSALRPTVSTFALASSERCLPLQASKSADHSSSSRSPHIHSSFKEIVDSYDAFILDQFGVLHDGVHALDGATETIQYLHQAGKKMIILSNTSAPSDKALKKLPKLGFVGEFFSGAVTSGEEASLYVKEKYGSGEITIKALFITWDALTPNNPRLTAPPQSFIDQCGNVEVVSSIDEADLVLLHGSEVWYRGRNVSQESLGSFITDAGFEVVDPILKRCLQRQLPMVCANPDLIVVTPAGGIAHMPGRIAQRYLELGGECRIFGKPDIEHFEACLRKLDIPRHRVAHVGDSLHHDVAGANGAGIASVFVSSGIHASQLGVRFGEMPSTSALESLFIEEGKIYPTHMIPSFRL